MTRTPVLLAFSFALIAAAGALYWQSRTDGREPDSPGPFAAPSATGRSPAFYRWMEEEERHRLARTILDSLTSAKAEILGHLKDDLVLLSRDERVIEMIRDAHAERADLSRYEAMAFADIFAGRKHPDLVEPARRLFLHPEFQVRHKGIEAARTQAHQSLTPLLLSMFRELKEREPESGSAIAGALLAAASRCGGPALLLLLAEALQDARPEVRGSALVVARQSGLEELRGRILPLLEDDELAVRFEAAATLASLGMSEGRDAVAGLLDPRDERVARLALAVVRAERIREAMDGVRRLAAEGGEYLRADARITLCALGDGEAIQRARAALAAGKAPFPERLAAIEGLAAALAGEDLEDLRGIARTDRAEEAIALASGLALRKDAAPGDILESLIEGGALAQTAPLHDLPARAGDALLTCLDRSLAAAGDDNRALFVIGIYGLIGTTGAREALLRHRRRFPTFVEQQVRLMDLDDLKYGRAP